MARRPKPIRGEKLDKLYAAKTELFPLPEEVVE